MALTNKQQKFIDEYMVDLNATQAAIRAGYSPRGAAVIGANLLTKIKIKEALQKRKSAARRRNSVTIDRIIAEYQAIAFSNIEDFSSFGPGGIALKDSKTIKKRKLAAVSEVSESVSAGGTTAKLKLHNKLSALDSLCKLLGFGGDKDDSADKAEAVKEAVKDVVTTLLRDTQPAPEADND